MASNTPGKRKPSLEELKAIATSKAPRVPPPASPPPGIKGTPPLPVGKPVSVQKGVQRTVSMTELEKNAMRRLGISEGDPIPEDVADIVAQYQAELASIGKEARQPVLPADPSTKPLKVNTVQLADLPPEKQAEVKNQVRQMLDAQNAAKAEREAELRAARMPKGVAEAMAVAEATSASARRTPQLKRQPPPEVVVDDDLAAYERLTGDISEEKAALFAAHDENKAATNRPSGPPMRKAKPISPEPARPEPAQQKSVKAQFDDQILAMMAEDGITFGEPEATPSAPSAPEEKETPPEEPAASEVPDLGAEQVQTHCPHCKADLGQPETPEPPYGDKMAFLHSVLGQKNYAREYQLFGGAVSVTFRTLTSKELDACFALAYDERQNGVLRSEYDFWERANRLRMVLMVQKLKSDEFFYTMPDGLSRETSPFASVFWEDADIPMRSEKPAVGTFHLAEVYDWVMTNVFRTEQLNRMVSNECQKFNRLVNKMEAMVDTPDFWQATAE